MNVVQSALIAAREPLSVAMLVEKTQLDREEVYTELVALEARGRAAPILGYFPQRPHIPAAGWISTGHGAARDFDFNPEDDL